MELTAKRSVLLNLRLIQNKSLHPVPTGGSADPGSVSSLSEKNYHPQWGKQRSVFLALTSVAGAKQPCCLIQGGPPRTAIIQN